MLTRDEIAEISSVVLGVFGSISIAVGVAASAAGIVGIAANRVAKLWQPHQPALQYIFFAGTGAIGCGMMMVGASMAIADNYSSSTQQLPITFSDTPPQKFTVPIGCAGCKYFSGEKLLPCAVHPELKENCPDCEPVTNLHK
jgi:hypothetical protein